MSIDRPYCAARASEERRLAIASAHPNVRKVHLEMATRYAAIGGLDVFDTDEAQPEPELLTA
jgi:hypothetical protein